MWRKISLEQNSLIDKMKGVNTDASQANAIRHRDGPMMVLAGPGSGKTLVITRRVQYLIEQYQVPPNQILVITFTRAAATQMRERFYRLMNGRRVPVTFGTFHAVYFTVLKHAYGYSSANIVPEERRIQFIREYIHQIGLDCEDESTLISSLLAEISYVKNAGMNLENYYATSCGEDAFRQTFIAYQKFLKRNRFLDFDDMLVFCRELFEKRKDILNAWQNKYRYILIDEFQDINRLQYDIIRMMAKPEDNLFIVGDDDQSIYRFRGAQPEIMLTFEKDYPQTKRLLLGNNYRSDAEIVRASANLISHNETRFSKVLTPTGENGYPVQIKEFGDQREQNEYLIREIGRLYQTGIGYQDMAVLFRTNMQARLLMEQMLSLNLPFHAKDMIPDLYEHWIVKDILAYIKIAMGDRSRGNFLRIMNRPKRYLSRESLTEKTIDFLNWEKYYQGQEWIAQRIRSLKADIEVIAAMRPFSAVNYIRRGVGYEEYLREYAARKRISFDDLSEVLDELQTNAKGFATYESWFSHIRHFREELRAQAKERTAQKDAVCLSTLHSAKGLEYHTVFIIDVNENIMPYKKAVLDADMEEERRMFYVGMTRAKKRLYLLYSRKIRNKEMEPSRFLAETKAEILR